MKIGYIRMNPKEENIEEQVKEFKNRTKVKRVYWEEISVKARERPEYERMMDYVREGDKIIVPEFAKFSGNIMELIKTIEELQKNGIDLVSEKEEFDSSTEEGKLKFKVIKAIAEFERILSRQRQREGIAAAKEAGKYKGYNGKEIPSNFAKYESVYYNGEITIKDMAEHYGVSRGTIYKWLRVRKEKMEKEQTEQE